MTDGFKPRNIWTTHSSPMLVSVFQKKRHRKRKRFGNGWQQSCLMTRKHIEFWWRIYASVDWVIVDPGNGLQPVNRQQIITPNQRRQMDPQEQTSVKFESKCQSIILIPQNAAEMSAKWRQFCSVPHVWKAAHLSNVALIRQGLWQGLIYYQQHGCSVEIMK